MNVDLLKILRCPKSGQRLVLEKAEYRQGSIYSGWLISEGGGHRYEIQNFIPRFVRKSNYADNFGMQWNKFRQTQLDSYSGHDISANRFWRATAWLPEDMDGQLVLDIGCGAGRFAEIALHAGAHVVALDYSNSVDACFANLRHYPNLHVVQGNIYELPLVKKAFRFVYSLGVLQHTPDVEKAFFALPLMLSEGGRICVDFYQKSWKSALLPKYWLRPFTKHMSRNRLFSMLEYLVPKLLPVSAMIGKFPVLGGRLKRLVPVANHIDSLPLSERQQLEWSLLDTFDWLSPEFDNPQTPETVRRWMDEAGLEQVEVLKAGHLVGRAMAPDKNGLDL